MSYLMINWVRLQQFVKNAHSFLKLCAGGFWDASQIQGTSINEREESFPIEEVQYNF